MTPNAHSAADVEPGDKHRNLPSPPNNPRER
jgi:hypothetical protein